MLKFKSETTGKNLILKFSGVYPPGSAGNRQARFISDKVKFYFNENISSHIPSRIILDFSDLDYVSGDAIGEVAIPFIEHNSPLSILAKGKTRDALLNLAPYTILGSPLVKISDSLSELMIE
jgi:hypothetical protein